MGQKLKPVMYLLLSIELNVTEFTPFINPKNIILP
jgi:hypothetical protein